MELLILATSLDARKMRNDSAFLVTGEGSSSIGIGRGLVTLWTGTRHWFATASNCGDLLCS